MRWPRAVLAAAARSSNHAPMWSFMGSGTDQTSLVALLQKTGRCSSARVADALRRVDRRFFVAPGTPAEAVYMVREKWPRGLSL